jgi:glycosyltransferase involved in cell wall biosynthesis
MKTILVITDNLQDQINGVVTTFKNIEALAVLDGYRILYLDPRQFLHFSCPGYPEVKLSVPWQIGKKIEALAPDYIHIATEGPIGLCARLYLDKRGYRYNTSYHTKFPEFINKIYHIPVSWTYSYVRWFHKHSGRVLTTTRGMVEDLEANGFEKVIPWTRGVNRDNLTPTKDRIINRDPVLVSVGRISKEKGLDDLIPLQWEFDIIIVGDGPYREELQRRMPSAEFVGYKSGSELADYYQQADVFVFSSRTDTFGLVMIEAMSLGTPVAAYPVRGPLDVIEQEVTGIMDNNLYLAVKAALELDRTRVQTASQKWTWDECWRIFRENLIDR